MKFWNKTSESMERGIGILFVLGEGRREQILLGKQGRIFWRMKMFFYTSTVQ